jgi:hypothetical protein
MSRTHVYACLALAACLGAPARADFIDASAYAAGTDVSNAAPGVTLRLISNDPATPNNYTPVYSPVVVTPCAAEACNSAGEALGLGPPVINGMDWEACYERGQLGLPSLDCNGTWRVLEVALNEDIGQLSIESVWTIDPPSMIALDSSGNEVLSCLSMGPGNPNTQPSSPAGCLTYTQFGSFGTYAGTASLDLTGLDVSRVIFASWTGFGVVTNVSYSVPEPGTMALMMLGLAGAFAARRRGRPQALAAIG